MKRVSKQYPLILVGGGGIQAENVVAAEIAQANA